ncbi:MAG: hypothetical protein CSA62_03480 [Planctomycetota bacterium]|nr:MAG: hypothetical protein CSA62_03480 [Planctomycetota bacterium]
MAKKSPRTMLIRRIVLYSLGSLSAAALIYACFYQAEPDSGTQLSIAEEHLKVVQMIPAQTQDAKLVTLRKQQLAIVRERLEKAEELSPGLAITREMQAFSSVLEGDYKRAAEWYEEALGCADSSCKDRGEVSLNLARVRIELSRFPGALAALEGIEPANRGVRWWVTRAHLAHRQNNLAIRGSALRRAFRAAKNNESDRKIVAEAAFDLGDDIATSCYQSLSKKTAMDWYRLAQLKVRAGQFDTANEALVRVRQCKPKLFEQLISADEEFWSRYKAEGFHPMGSQAIQAARPSK